MILARARKWGMNGWSAPGTMAWLFAPIVGFKKNGYLISLGDDDPWKATQKELMSRVSRITNRERFMAALEQASRVIRPA